MKIIFPVHIQALPIHKFLYFPDHSSQNKLISGGFIFQVPQSVGKKRIIDGFLKSFKAHPALRLNWDLFQFDQLSVHNNGIPRIIGKPIPYFQILLPGPMIELRVLIPLDPGTIQQRIHTDPAPFFYFVMILKAASFHSISHLNHQPSHSASSAKFPDSLFRIQTNNLTNLMYHLHNLMWHTASPPAYKA